MKEELEYLGFKNITKEKPISFHECFGVDFDELYSYSDRYSKSINSITTTLLVAEYGIWSDIEGIVVHQKGWQKFHLHGLRTDILKQLNRTLKIIEKKIYNENNN